MKRTVIITSKCYKSVCSVIRGTDEQIRAIVNRDPVAYEFHVTKPSDWDYRGEVIDLDSTAAFNVCRDILKGVAKLPEDLRWLVR